MESAKSSPRTTTISQPDDRKNPVRAQAVDSGIPRKLNATAGASGKNPVDARVDPNKRPKTTPRDTKAPHGPRPLETASRRVPSDAPTTPRRSQLPSTTSEPFLGLSARKRPAPTTPGQAAASSRNKDTERRRRPDAAASTSVTNGGATIVSKSSAGSGEGAKLVTTGDQATVSRDLASPNQLAGSSDISAMAHKDPALRAAQLSTASASALPTSTPLTIRTRRQLRYPSAASDWSEDQQTRTLAPQDLTIATSAAKDSLTNANRRALQSKSPTSTSRNTPNIDNGLRVQSKTRANDQPVSNGSHLLRKDKSDPSSPTSTPPNIRRLKPKSPDPIRTPQSDTILRTSSSLKPILVDVTSPISAKRQSIALAHNGGMLARTVSPTDVRRIKRVPEGAQSFPVYVGSPTPEVTRERPALASPPLSRRRSSSPSSDRGTPDLNQGYGADISLSSQSSFNSLRPLSATLQQRSLAAVPVSRNSSIHSRTTLSSAGGGDVGGVVPPVPAIPKAYGSSRNVSEEQQYSRFEEAVLQTVPSLRDQIPRERATATTDFQPNVLGSSFDARHRRGLTLGSGLDGTNYHPLETASTRQPSQPLRLPPLNVLPLSQPTTAKIEALTTRQQDEQSSRITPPGAPWNKRTPTTPMTASRATFTNNDLRFANDMSSVPSLRNRPTHRVPAAASSRDSSPTVFLTPSPATSPTPLSDEDSTPLPSVPDVEEQSVRERKRNEMLASKHRLVEAKSPESLDQHATAYGRTGLTKTLTAVPGGTAAPGSSAGHRNFSQKLQQLRDEMSLQKQGIKDFPPVTQPPGVRRAVSLGRVKPLQTDDDTGSDATKVLRPAASTERDALKTQLTASNKVDQNMQEAIATAATPQVASTGKAGGDVPPPSQKSVSSRDSRNPLKPQEADAFDVDAFAADEEMRKLAASRKDFEAAAKELDELRRRTAAKERLSPSQALRTENLNIFERGEIIDYKDIYFCGTKTAKKFVGDLTSQAANFGFDDERGDYNLVVSDHLAYRYEVLDLLGKGSFGQVVRCIDHKTGGLVAVKIIRNKKRFHQQALVEVNILRQLKEWDPQAKHSMINFTQSFYFRGHLCISTELLGMNLYEFIKAYDFRGFSLRLIRRFTKQMLSSLCLLQSHKVIHCDMKPENILLAHPLRSEIKVIDFGSSCFENEKVYTYIQSRFYRSPEVILGMDYGMPIDMWSLGCILAELYTGYPIFPGENEQEQLACIMEIFGPPEKHLIEQCTRKKLFFDSMGKPRVTVSSKGKRRRPSSKTLQTAIKCDDEAFLDFLSRCLRWDPARRLKPDEAMSHDFLVGLKKRTHTPVLRAVSSASPAKRYTIQTPARSRPLAEAVGASVKTGAIAAGSGNSPIKTAQPLRRHSTVSGLPPSVQTTSKQRSTNVAAGSALPRAVPRNASGKPDLASAAAIASIVSP